MSNEFQDDYLLLEKDKNLFNSKVKKQKFITLIILLLFGFLIYFVYQEEIDRFLPNRGVITVESKDKSKKISLMKKNFKYQYGSDPCPEGYHIPTAYEWETAFRIRCKNNKNCDINDIEIKDSSSSYAFYYGHYRDERFTTILKQFVKDFNIYLDRKYKRDPFIHGMYREKILGVKYTNIFGETDVCSNWEIKIEKLSSHVKNDASFCRETKYIRCFSDENLTPEYMNDESVRTGYNLIHTQFEIDGKIYSGRKINGYNGYSFNKNVVIPDNFEGIPIIEIGEGAFERHGYTSVIFGKNLVKISDKAFSSNKISEISIPESVIYIGKRAFSNNQLTSIIIPNSVKFIGDGAFSGNEIISNDLLGHSPEK